MIQKTVTNLYPFIVSQLPRLYDQHCKRTRFDDAGIPLHTCLIVCKGPRHHLIVSYNRHVEEFTICIRKPQGYINEIIDKYA